MELSIIIVNWNSAQFVRACLASLQREVSGLNYEVMVVDNASFDGCGEMLAREFPQVRFIQSPTNVGFAKANNLGCKSASGDFLLFLNPDTEIKGPAIQMLLGAARRLPEPGIVGAKLFNPDGTVQTNCVQAFPTIANQVLDAEALRRVFPRSSLWGIAALYDNGKSAVEVDVIVGACMLVSRTVFDNIGGFSEDYFMYSEDVDLCYKTRRAGRRNYLLPAAVIVHFGGGSSQKSTSLLVDVMMRESRYHYFRKFRGGPYAGLYRLAMAASAIVRLLLMTLMLPIRFFGGKHEELAGPLRKWRHIFYWSLKIVATPEHTP